MLMLLSTTLAAQHLIEESADSGLTGSLDEPAYHPVLVNQDSRLPIASIALQNSSTLRWQFNALGRDYTLLLSLSNIADHASIAIDGQPDATPHTSSLQPLLVRGQVEGDPTSSVRGTLDQNGFTGWLATDNRQYLIEHSRKLKLPGEDRLILFDKRAAGKTLLSLDDIRSAPPADSPGLQNLSNEAADSRQLAAPEFTLESFPRSALSGRNGVTRTLPIGIVVDSLYNEQRDDQGVAAALSVLNIVDGIYQRELGVAIDVQAIVLLADANADPLRELDSNIDDILTAFRQIRMEQPALPAALSLVHLFSGLRDPDDVLGLAWIGSACRTDGYDVSVSLPHRFEVLLAAHEIAHNLGALHDDNLACAPTHNNIMAAHLTRTTNAEFSACSREFMAPLVQAACNQDNIDLSVTLTLEVDANGNSQLMLTMHNHDNARVAPAMVAEIDFPTQLAPSTVARYCRFDRPTLTCTFDALAAGDRRDITLPLGHENRPATDLHVELRPIGFSDINSGNNHATVRLPALITAAQDPATVTVQTNANAGGSAGTGSADLLVLCLAGIAGWRQRNR